MSNNQANGLWRVGACLGLYGLLGCSAALSQNAPTWEAQVISSSGARLGLGEGARQFAETKATPALGDEAQATSQHVGQREGASEAAEKIKVTDEPATNPSATVNLVNILLKKGIINEEQATAIIQQSKDEAYVSGEAVKDAASKADSAEKTATSAKNAVSPPGTKRVTYVPEVVKQQLRADLRKEVMEQAQAEGWANPNVFPKWASALRIYGDVRGRYEGDFFPAGNDQEHAYNFNAINTGSPYDESKSNNNFPPLFNVTKDRERARIRARLGLTADLGDGFDLGFRIASGDSNAPVSTNQTLGGSGGNFSKYNLWLDRAYLKYQPIDGADLAVGRFDNPFYSTELVWDRDLGFDGAAVRLKGELLPGFTPFFAGGAFPIYNTAFDLSAVSPDAAPAKQTSHDKYLFGAQVGADVEVTDKIAAKLGAAYYDFNNVEGHLSSPCFVLNASSVCDTDVDRPTFAQKGNTYRVLRNIFATAENNNGTTNLFQYYGLATDYNVLALTGRLDLGHFHPVHVTIDAEYVRNLAFDKEKISSIAVTNRGPGPATNVAGPYDGGNEGYMAFVTVGYQKLDALWDWNFHAGYKYLESDAVVDAFADSDFGLGGTNLKGYFIGGNLALGPKVWTSFEWMSADNIAGIPYSADVLQVDINGKF